VPQRKERGFQNKDQNYDRKLGEKEGEQWYTIFFWESSSGEGIGPRGWGEKTLERNVKANTYLKKAEETPS